MSKTVKCVLVVVSAALVLVLAAGFVVGNYFYNLALNPAADRSIVLSASHNAVGTDTDVSTETDYGAVQRWFEETGHTDEHINSDDGLRLHAYKMEQDPRENQWAILCHGYGGYGGHMTYSAKRFADMGYNVLMPDARGLGESEGSYIGMGWHDRLDILRWIDRVLEWNPEADIVLYGISMGGATVMMTAGEALPENVRVIVEDCGYTSVWDEFSYQLKEIFGLPAFPAMQFASLVTKIRAGYTFGEASALEQVKKSQTPILFIHGSEDTFVPSYMVQMLYEAAPAPKELLWIEGAGHGAAASVGGEMYWETVWAFIDKHMI